MRQGSGERHNLGRASNVLDMQAVALPLENRVFLMFL